MNEFYRTVMTELVESMKNKEFVTPSNPTMMKQPKDMKSFMSRFNQERGGDKFKVSDDSISIHDATIQLLENAVAAMKKVKVDSPLATQYSLSMPCADPGPGVHWRTLLPHVLGAVLAANHHLLFGGDLPSNAREIVQALSTGDLGKSVCGTNWAILRLLFSEAGVPEAPLDLDGDNPVTYMVSIAGAVPSLRPMMLQWLRDQGEEEESIQSLADRLERGLPSMLTDADISDAMNRIMSRLPKDLDPSEVKEWITAELLKEGIDAEEIGLDVQQIKRPESDLFDGPWTPMDDD